MHNDNNSEHVILVCNYAFINNYSILPDILTSKVN